MKKISFDKEDACFIIVSGCHLSNTALLLAYSFIQSSQDLFQVRWLEGYRSHKG